mmetsp:Transcript_64398/g.186649  ORF Transcript_64398/g.186649 Transcript_64398/m.186649 type:complete len:297 (-) Transcript_64398:123-1013(-)
MHRMPFERAEAPESEQEFVGQAWLEGASGRPHFGCNNDPSARAQGASGRLAAPTRRSDLLPVIVVLAGLVNIGWELQHRGSIPLLPASLAEAGVYPHLRVLLRQPPATVVSNLGKFLQHVAVAALADLVRFPLPGVGLLVRLQHAPVLRARHLAHAVVGRRGLPGVDRLLALAVATVEVAIQKGHGVRGARGLHLEAIAAVVDLVRLPHPCHVLLVHLQHAAVARVRHLAGATGTSGRAGVHPQQTLLVAAELVTLEEWHRSGRAHVLHGPGVGTGVGAPAPRGSGGGGGGGGDRE